MELERDQFEEVALAHFVAQRAAGVQISGDNGCEPTRESLFWRDDKGDYGVRMFNAAWWGWKEAAIATRKTCEVPPMDEAAMARLSKIERQEPVAEMTLVDIGIGDARQLRVNWLMDGYLDVGAKLYAAAGASPVEPSQEWKPALSPATISTAPAYLNTNDKAMWVLGWNECLNAQPPAPGEAAAQGQDLLEIMCARIKAADDAMADGNYMLDSDDCISVIRGTWKPPMLNDKPAAPIPQQPAPSVPEGWKLVPIEPTEAMLEVGFFAENDVFDSAKTKRIHVWKDMLSAAPQPKDMK